MWGGGHIWCALEVVIISTSLLIHIPSGRSTRGLSGLQPPCAGSLQVGGSKGEEERRGERERKGERRERKE
jgi:hypothetical protein